ncbi:hypothetical protein CcaverHIS641_0306020 [Cutaneotrichosporon cavernicola]|nr:hypothetical protein CcaverHIS641_0306020 [Cutaneotrichosporon cavernicola]
MSFASPTKVRKSARPTMLVWPSGSSRATAISAANLDKLVKLNEDAVRVELEARGASCKRTRYMTRSVLGPSLIHTYSHLSAFENISADQLGLVLDPLEPLATYPLR